MNMKIIVETPLLPDLLEAYLENDALELERALNNEDVLVDSVLEARSNVANSKNFLAVPITNLLNEYLNLFESTEKNQYLDDADEISTIIHEIVSTIVELIPSVIKIEMLSDEATSLVVYCGDNE